LFRARDLLTSPPSAGASNKLFADQKRGGYQRNVELEPLTHPFNDFRASLFNHFHKHLPTLRLTKECPNHTIRQNHSTQYGIRIEQALYGHLFMTTSTFAVLVTISWVLSFLFDYLPLFRDHPFICKPSVLLSSPELERLNHGATVSKYYGYWQKLGCIASATHPFAAYEPAVSQQRPLGTLLDDGIGIGSRCQYGLLTQGRWESE
jgi:hypothetical protein